MLHATGVMQTVVEDDADDVVHGYSVQKLAVATAVMDKIDRGQLRLDQKLDLTADLWCATPAPPPVDPPRRMPLQQ
jgi:beta-lactamase class A